MSFPVTSDCENVNVILLYVINFLTDIVLNNNFISKTSRLNSLNTFKHVIANIQLSTAHIKAITSNSNNKIITQFLCPAKKIYMSLMQEIICAISDNFFHTLFSKIIFFKAFTNASSLQKKFRYECNF